MPQRHVFPQWRRQHADTNFPFAADARLRNDAGTVVPRTAFVDGVLYPAGAGVGLHLRRVEIAGATATFVLADATGLEAATAVCDLLTPPEALVFADAWDRPAGLLVAVPQELAALQGWSQGAHAFRREDTEFAVAVHVSMPAAGLLGLALDDGSLFAGDVWLVGGDGVVLRRTTVVGIDGGTYDGIRVDVVGDPLFRRKLCGETFETPRFVRALRVRHPAATTFTVTPDGTGTIRLDVSGLEASVLRVEADGDAVTLRVLGGTIAEG